MKINAYCAKCCVEPAKTGSPLSLTQWCDYPVCRGCESKLANGLVHYRPSNGTEFSMFYSRCEDCRHFDHGGIEDPAVRACGWGVLDKLLNAMPEGYDSEKLWFDPADLTPDCPATCLRFTPIDYGFDDRDPPKPDVPGQLTFDDAMEVPERVPSRGEGVTA